MSDDSDLAYLARFSRDYTPTLRDRIAWRLANAALRIASPWYRSMIGGSIEYGLRSAVRDEREHRTPPPA